MVNLNFHTLNSTIIVNFIFLKSNFHYHDSFNFYLLFFYYICISHILFIFFFHTNIYTMFDFYASPYFCNGVEEIPYILAQLRKDFKLIMLICNR
jgi:hypothetical protein